LATGETTGPALPIRSLLSPDCFPHPADSIELIETHISWVLLAGDFAYKLKKPVNLGFLDFTTLERRAHFCAEELRINRRLAPDLYLDVATLRRDGGRLQFGDEGQIIEYAVLMRRFDQDQQLDRCLERGDFGPTEVDQISQLIGDFHESAPEAPEDSDWGRPEVVVRSVRENFSHLGPKLADGSREEAVERLRSWTEGTFADLAPEIARRRLHGRVRECHGDLHLRNMARIGGKIVAFDGIEFDPALRWIDVVSDSAFLVMDLESRGRRELAWRFLNGWLRVTGDYEGLSLLRWYLAYRHMVRAKVDAIRLGQSELEPAEAGRLGARIDRHLALALEVAAGPAPRLVIACGVSGSGKSWLSERLAERMPAVWLRSDVERKRLFGMSATERPAPERVTEVYGTDASLRTYQRMAELAEIVLRSGLTVIADATYLRRRDREALVGLASRLGAPAIILACGAPMDVLEGRVRRRQLGDHDPSDADLEVLRDQLGRRDPFAENEPTIEVETVDSLDIDLLLASIEGRLRGLSP
jgi:aminoglycoside phosphotransferase family enzyme/predicted kinase